MKADYSSSTLQIDKMIQDDNIINKEEIEIEKADDNNEFIMSSSEGGREQQHRVLQQLATTLLSIDAERRVNNKKLNSEVHR